MHINDERLIRCLFTMIIDSTAGKGADCISKWIGESERMLRLLFDQAYKMRPSIIFFDEIDGLAPVRSSRMDQSYSSIVSTLLAMMDGLDSRGEIVVIGATNRPDNIDPALRRPGRFDREFVFPLPSQEARRRILGIHTREWKPVLNPGFIDELAERCEGFCGADLKALCTEAALVALGRHFPEIYTSNTKLPISMSSIRITGNDFISAFEKITPAQQRAKVPACRKLRLLIIPLARRPLNEILREVAKILPKAYASRRKVTSLIDDCCTAASKDVCITAANTSNADDPEFFNFDHNPFAMPQPHRPRYLVVGKRGMCQTTDLCPAVLSELQKYPIRTLDLASMYSEASVRVRASCFDRIPRGIVLF